MDFARIVVALNHQVTKDDTKRHVIKDQRNVTHVAHTMRMAGFVTRNNTDDEMMYHYAKLIFDSDEESVRRGFSIPQVWKHICVILNDVEVLQLLTYIAPNAYCSS